MIVGPWNYTTTLQTNSTIFITAVSTVDVQ